MLYFNGAFICWVQNFGQTRIPPHEHLPAHQHGAVIIVKLTKLKRSTLPQPTKTKTTFEFHKHIDFFDDVKGALEEYTGSLGKANPHFKHYMDLIRECESEVNKIDKALAFDLKNTAAGIKGILAQPQDDAYYQTISSPLSLGDMTAKVLAEEYDSSVKEFAADLKHVFANAAHYHSTVFFEAPVKCYTCSKKRSIDDRFGHNPTASEKAQRAKLYAKAGVPYIISVADIMTHRGIPDVFEQAILVANAADYPDLTRAVELNYHTRIFIPGERDVGLVKMLIDFRDTVPRKIAIMEHSIQQSKEWAPEDNWAMVSMARRLQCTSQMAPLFVFGTMCTSSSQII